MYFKKLIWAGIALLLAAALTSCTIGATPEPTTDVSAIFTFAALTMDAQLSDQGTQTAQAASPTPLVTYTPLPTFPVIPLGSTPFSISTPGGGALPTNSTGGSTLGSTAVGCDNSSYLSETPPNDGTQLTAGDTFKKGWSLQNTGTCAWNSGYSFAFITGDQMGGKDIVLSKDDDRGGLRLLAELRGLGVLAPVVVITAYADVDKVKTALNEGAAHLLEKPFRASELCDLIRRVQQPGAGVQHGLEQVLVRANLTDKEDEVARYLLDGLSGSEIAERSKNSPKTIRQHVTRIYEKCGVASRAEFFRLVYPH